MPIKILYIGSAISNSSSTELIGKSHSALRVLGREYSSRERAFSTAQGDKNRLESQTRAFSGCGLQFSIADAREPLPLSKVTLESDAFRFFRLAGKLSGIPGAGGRGEPGRGPKMLTQLEEKRLCLAFDRASRRNSPLLFRLSRRSRCWGYCEVMLQILSRSFQVSPSRTLILAQ